MLDVMWETAHPLLGVSCFALLAFACSDTVVTVGVRPVMGLESGLVGGWGQACPGVGIRPVLGLGSGPVLGLGSGLPWGVGAMPALGLGPNLFWVWCQAWSEVGVSVHIKRPSCVGHLTYSGTRFLL